MLNLNVNEAGQSFGGNLNYQAQSQAEVENTVAEDVSQMSDSTLGKKNEDENYDESNNRSENHYLCHHLIGGAAHPGIIVETAGLANIKPPPPVYRPRLPLEMITGGKISEIQLERIIYAGQAHSQKLPNSAARAGISVGD